MSDLNLGALLASARHWIDGLDRADERRRVEAGSPFPDWRTRLGRMTVHLLAVPRPVRLDADPQSGLGGHCADDAEWRVDIAKGAWSTLEKKFDRYKTVREPLVVAVNDIRPLFAGAEEYRGILLGELASFPLAGLWWHAGRSRHAHISALLCFTQTLQPWTMATDRPYLVLNPWANRSLDRAVLPFESYEPDPQGRLRKLSEGTLSAYLLGLFQDWPELEE